MASWLINVNATKYNILGSVRDLKGEIPWHINKDVSIGDTVFFYLTGASSVYSPIDDLYGRFLFLGEVTNIGDEPEKDDSKYWNDKVKQDKVESSGYKYAMIKITQNLYDDKIKSDNVSKDIWKQQDVYELDDKMVQSIREQIKSK